MASTSKPEELRGRTKRFALLILKLFQSLPRTDEARILGRQLLRSATSVAANYRAVCRARSKKEFIAKLGIVLEEADECLLWLELLEEGGILGGDRTEDLHREANELAAIFNASLRTAKSSRD